MAGVGRYDPAARRIILPHDASLYTIEHEFAHALQHALSSRLFYFWKWSWWIPWVRHLAQLLLELDADERARQKMQREGTWTEETETESQRVIARYARELLKL